MAKDTFGIEQIIGRLALSDKVAASIIDGSATEDTFKEAFDKIWISKEKAKNDPEIIDPAIKAHDGKLFTQFENVTKKAAEKLGVPFEKEDMKIEGRDIKAVEMVDVLAAKVEAQFGELKEHASKGNDEKVIKLEKKLEEGLKETDHFKGLYQEKDAAFNELQTESQATLQSFKIDTKLSQAVGRIKFKDDISDIERSGYDAEIGKLGKELTEEDKLVLKGPDGEVFWNENQTVELTADEAVMAIADKYKLVKKNDLKGVLQGNQNGSNAAPEGKKLREVKAPMGNTEIAD